MGARNGKIDQVATTNTNKPLTTSYKRKEVTYYLNSASDAGALWTPIWTVLSSFIARHDHVSNNYHVIFFEGDIGWGLCSKKTPPKL
ncbi:hypothetical protein CR513_62362, partial [Mucuna pruriens]